MISTISWSLPNLRNPARYFALPDSQAASPRKRGLAAGITECMEPRPQRKPEGPSAYGKAAAIAHDGAAFDANKSAGASSTDYSQLLPVRAGLLLNPQVAAKSVKGRRAVQAINVHYLTCETYDDDSFAYFSSRCSKSHEAPGRTTRRLPCD